MPFSCAYIYLSILIILSTSAFFCSQYANRSPKYTDFFMELNGKQRDAVHPQTPNYRCFLVFPVIHRDRTGNSLPNS